MTNAPITIRTIANVISAFETFLEQVARGQKMLWAPTQALAEFVSKDFAEANDIGFSPIGGDIYQGNRPVYKLSALPAEQRAAIAETIKAFRAIADEATARMSATSRDDYKATRDAVVADVLPKLRALNNKF